MNPKAMRTDRKFFLALALFLSGVAVGSWIAVKPDPVFERRGESAEPSLAQTSNPLAVAPASIDDLLSSLMGAVAEDDPLKRASELYELLGQATPAKFASLWERAIKIPDVQRRDFVLSALLRRWIAIDPSGAQTASQPFRDRFRKMKTGIFGTIEGAVEQAWAEAMPEKVLAEAIAAPDDAWASTTGRWALQTLAGGDPLRQLKTLISLPPSKLRSSLADLVIRGLARTDPLAAEARLGLITDPTVRYRLQADILGQFAERDPVAALNRFQELAPQLVAGAVGARLTSTIFTAAAKKDAVAALAALDQVPPDFRQQATASVLVSWAGKDPMAALAWASKNGVAVAETWTPTFIGPSGFVSTISLTSAAFQADREKTLEWILAQPASSNRDDMLVAGLGSQNTEQRLAIFAKLSPDKQSQVVDWVMQGLEEKDSAQCRTWVESLPPGTVRSIAIERASANKIGADPQQVEAIIEGWPQGLDRDSALKGAASRIASQEPLRAVEYARRITDPDQREDAFQTLAFDWRRRDQAAAKAWVSSSSDFTPEKKRVLLRQFDEF